MLLLGCKPAPPRVSAAYCYARPDGSRVLRWTEDGKPQGAEVSAEECAGDGAAKTIEKSQRARGVR